MFSFMLWIIFLMLCGLLLWVIKFCLNILILLKFVVVIVLSFFIRLFEIDMVVIEVFMCDFLLWFGVICCD